MARQLRRQPGAPMRGGTPVAGRPNKPSKPACPRHLGEMKFDPGTMVWRCLEPDCQMIGLPKEDIDAGKGKPTVGEGALEIVKVTSDKNGTFARWFLKAPDNNVMLEVTDYVDRVETLPTRGPRATVISLRIVNVTELRQE